MAANYRALTESRLILFRPSGSLEHEDLKTILQPLDIERLSIRRWNRFLDFSRVQDFELNYAGLNQLSASLERQNKFELGQEPLFRVAILCTETYAFGLARMIASVLERNGLEIRAFRDLRELCSWLALPPESLIGEQEQAPS